MTSPNTYTLYLDETGEATLTKINPEYRVFGLGDVLIKDIDLAKITNDLSLVKDAVFWNPNIVLNSVELRKRKRDFKVLNDPARMDLFYRLFNEFIENANISFLSVFVDKPAHITKYKRPYDPYEWSTTLLMKRLSYILDDVKGTGRIILEARGKDEDRAIKNAFVITMHAGTRFVDSGTFLRSIDPNIEFEPKSLNGTGLQLADMMLYQLRERF